MLSLIYRVGQNPYMYIYAPIYDRIFGDFPTKKPYIHRTYIHMVMANPVLTVSARKGVEGVHLLQIWGLGCIVNA